MPCNRVYRLNVTAKTRQRARIDQGQLRITQARLQLLGTQYQVFIRRTLEGAARRRHGIQAQRETGRMPRFQTAIEHKHTVALAQPGKQPPCACGKRTWSVVIHHHVAVCIDAPRLQALNQCPRIGQRMTARHTFDHRAAQVPFQVCILRAFDMPFAIAATAIVGVFQGKAAVQNNQAGLRLTFFQGVRADQLRNGHSELL